MPIMSDKVTYGNLAIKPPVTLRMELLKSTILGAKQLFGTTSGGRTVDNVRWGLEVHVCREGEPDCVTTHHALSVVFQSDRGGNRWIVLVYVERYYVEPSAQFVFDAFRFGQETDVYIDIIFRDSKLFVIFNGRTLLETDLLKKFEQIRTLKANNYFFDPAGAEIPGVGDQYLVYNLKLVETADIAGIVSTILPIAIGIAVFGVVFAVLRYIVPAIRR